jgi:hypothetical protein
MVNFKLIPSSGTVRTHVQAEAAIYIQSRIHMHVHLHALVIISNKRPS